MIGAASERASAVVELVILVPAVVLLLLFVVLAGRVAQAQNDVYGAASDAARAASIRQHPRSAARDARTTAERVLSSRGVTCRSLRVDVDSRRLRPAGHVRVGVRCVVALRDLAPLGVPGSRTVSASATEVVDRFRSR